jgi:outer membrane protein TolC
MKGSISVTSGRVCGPSTERTGASGARRLTATLCTLGVMGATALSGCASLDAVQATAQADALTRQHAGAQLALHGQDATRTSALERTQALLREPLQADDAVRLALSQSPAVQALLAESWSRQLGVQQSARPPQPRLAFERAVRGDERELGRALSVGLLDLLLWPLRAAPMRTALQAEQLRLAGEVLRHAHEVRSQWVRAVAAQQRLGYQQQVLEAAEASAELARRMQAVGHFSRLQRVRQQQFEAEARTQMARAELHATQEREALVRLLGLPAQEARQLRLPERLPDLPVQAMSAAQVAQAASQQRLDLQMARAAWERAGGDAALIRAASWTDVELKRFDQRETGQPRQRGWELELALPLFDLGAAQRQSAGAQQLAALNRLQQMQLEAGSGLRQQHAAYRTSWELVRQQRDEVLPLATAAREETLLLYNGMLGSVFDLLMQARAQVQAVMGLQDALRDFWLADAALRSSLLGVPVSLSPMTMAEPAGAAPGGMAAGH